VELKGEGEIWKRRKDNQCRYNKRILLDEKINNIPKIPSRRKREQT